MPAPQHDFSIRPFYSHCRGDDLLPIFLRPQWSPPLVALSEVALRVLLLGSATHLFSICPVFFHPFSINPPFWWRSVLFFM